MKPAIDRYARMVGGGEWPEHEDHYQLATVMVGAIGQTVITWLLYGRPKSIPKEYPR